VTAAALPEDIAQARVVVVDDNVPSLQLVQSLLTRVGFRSVRGTTDAVQLLDRYAELAPELVVLDLHMPGIDGYAALAELRRRATAADLPVLVLTADTTREATHRALQLGGNDFLTKPLDATELVLRVRNLLQTRSLHVGLQRRHRWLEASGRLAADLLADVCPEPLRRVSELAREAAAAEAAVVVLPGVSAEQAAPVVSPHVWVGDDAGAIAAAIADAFEMKELAPDAPRLVADLAVVSGDQAGRLYAGPAMLIPLPGAERLIGALLLCRRRGRPAFTESELELACGFAGQAVVAVEFAQARTDQERMLVLADRHRIARDLHDQVIQRLFATGLRLQQLSVRMGPGPIADRIDQRVDELDETISEIRSTIFGLRQEAGAAPPRLTMRMRELVAELSEVLGFEPRLMLEEPLDVVPDDIADDLVAAAREAITNVARHAGALHADVSITLSGSYVVLEVFDDGVGIGNAARRSGLTNLNERALRHSGNCAAGPAPDGGTRVVWTASLVHNLPSVIDRDDCDGPVGEEVIRAGVVASEAGRRDPLDLDSDVERAVRAIQSHD
jgi:signal transduction histidine kinase